LEVTDAELKEAMAIAMTVGATKIRILQESALASLLKRGAFDPRIWETEIAFRAKSLFGLTHPIPLRVSGLSDRLGCAVLSDQK
jgi:hypothetical protein